MVMGGNMKNTKFICEFTTNHMGNLNILLEMVKKAHETGADYIKMQKKDVDTFYSSEKLNMKFKSPYGKTYHDYRKIFEFGERDFKIFDEECKKYGIDWFATAQDFKSLEFLLGFDLQMYKVASCNANKQDMLKEFSRCIPTDKTVVVSCAGRTLDEIRTAANIFNSHKMIINHCVAEYPCKNSNLRFGNIGVLLNEFSSDKDRIEIGYSGHEEGILPTYGAITSGATCIERHFCLSRDSFVHHIECSLEPHEYKEMVSTVRSGRIPENIREILGEEAYKINFGMTEMEESFLVKNTYGSDYVNEARK